MLCNRAKKQFKAKQPDYSPNAEEKVVRTLQLAPNNQVQSGSVIHSQTVSRSPKIQNQNQNLAGATTTSDEKAEIVENKTDTGMDNLPWIKNSDKREKKKITIANVECSVLLFYVFFVNKNIKNSKKKWQREPTFSMEKQVANVEPLTTPKGLIACVENYVYLCDVNSQKGRKFVEHTSYVSSAQITTDGRFLVSGSYDHLLYIWNLQSRMILYRLQGHSDFVNSVDVSSGCERIVSASDDRTVGVWDIAQGKQIHCLKGHYNSTTDARFRKGQFNEIVSSSYDNTVRLWDLRVGTKEVKTLRHLDGVTGVDFSPVTNTVASSCFDKIVHVWDLASTNEEVNLLKGHTEKVMKARFSSDGLLVVSASFDTTVRLWDVEGEFSLQILKGHSKRVNSAVFSADDMCVWSCSDDCTVRLWTRKKLIDPL
ncbi:WD-40 repeat protein [Reticulomyxa filosa]|uniref:WD-40 repeat protein n=1 Tax=Reticulomyxa filosa TaxID=46433 RepID=X6P4W1_RETFI|nr:WD-40 repeat protein [Reticulomyxa filosa]|eukprot:ETO33580.1 WD-40 repeat protein [Reticulomyxa filosa]